MPADPNCLDRAKAAFDAAVAAAKAKYLSGELNDQQYHDALKAAAEKYLEDVADCFGNQQGAGNPS